MWGLSITKGGAHPTDVMQGEGGAPLPIYRFTSPDSKPVVLLRPASLLFVEYPSSVYIIEFLLKYIALFPPGKRIKEPYPSLNAIPLYTHTPLTNYTILKHSSHVERN